MKLIILDRDGVINVEFDDYIKSPEEWLPIPGSLEAIARLTQAEYRIMIATNQSGVGRGLFDEATLARIHEKMLSLVEAHGGKIEKVFYCPHHPDDQCKCRKPEPGLYEQIAEYVNDSLQDVPSVGDSLRDLQAASAVGCHPILVRTGKGEKTEKNNPNLAVPIYNNLADVVEDLL